MRLVRSRRSASILVTALLVGSIALGCSSAPSGEPDPKTASDALKKRKADAGTDADAASPGNGATPPTGACSTLDEAACASRTNCRGAYIGICDCTCGAVADDLGDGCAACAASCFTFQRCIEVGDD